jgi:hypothetical protein
MTSESRCDRSRDLPIRHLIAPVTYGEKGYKNRRQSGIQNGVWGLPKWRNTAMPLRNIWQKAVPALIHNRHPGCYIMAVSGLSENGSFPSVFANVGDGFEPSVPLRNPRADGRLSRHARSAIRTRKVRSAITISACSLSPRSRWKTPVRSRQRTRSPGHQRRSIRGCKGAARRVCR